MGFESRATDGGKTVFENLCLLGVNPDTFQRRYGVVLSEVTFQASNNRKAALPVLHALFDRIDPGVTASAFKSCWPVLDRVHERDFLRISYERLTDLERDKVLPVGSCRRSVLDTCGGDRFVQLLLYLSLYALKCFLSRELQQHVSCPTELEALPITDVELANWRTPVPILQAKISGEARNYATASKASKEAQRNAEVGIAALRSRVAEARTSSFDSDVEAPDLYENRERSDMVAVQESAQSLMRGWRDSAHARTQAIGALNDDASSRVISNVAECSELDIADLLEARANGVRSLLATSRRDLMEQELTEAAQNCAESHMQYVTTIRSLTLRTKDLTSKIDQRIAHLRTQMSGHEPTSVGFLPETLVGSEYSSPSALRRCLGETSMPGTRLQRAGGTQAESMGSDEE